MMDDSWTQSPHDLWGLKGNMFTKIRIDVPCDDGVKSVHHLEHDGARIAAFSTGNILKDFYKPTQQERQKVVKMVNMLETLGVRAFVCNETHHLIVIYEDLQSSTIMSPEHLAQLLQDPSRGEDIMTVLNAACNPKMSQSDVQHWKESYIAAYK